MAAIKTVRNKASVAKFLAAIENEERRKDGKALLKLFKDTVKEKPEIWGTSIIGFGAYHYQSERSSQQGDWPLTGFSPRKQNLTVYIMNGPGNYPALLKKLGKYKISSGSCLYINRLADIDTGVLQEIISRSYSDMKKKHGVK